MKVGFGFGFDDEHYGIGLPRVVATEVDTLLVYQLRRCSNPKENQQQSNSKNKKQIFLFGDLPRGKYRLDVLVDDHPNVTKTFDNLIEIQYDENQKEAIFEPQVHTHHGAPSASLFNRALWQEKQTLPDQRQYSMPTQLLEEIEEEEEEEKSKNVCKCKPKCNVLCFLFFFSSTQ